MLRFEGDFILIYNRALQNDGISCILKYSLDCGRQFGGRQSNATRSCAGVARLPATSRSTEGERDPPQPADPSISWYRLAGSEAGLQTIPSWTSTSQSDCFSLDRTSRRRGKRRSEREPADLISWNRRRAPPCVRVERGLTLTSGMRLVEAGSGTLPLLCRLFPQEPQTSLPRGNTPLFKLIHNRVAFTVSHSSSIIGQSSASALLQVFSRCALTVPLCMSFNMIVFFVRMFRVLLFAMIHCDLKN